MAGFPARIRASLEQRREARLLRGRLTLDSAQGPLVRLGGREYLNFCSNDYLGHAAHPAVVRAFCDAAAEYGVGSGASHLVCGHSRPHHELEDALAELTGRSRALLFSSGYAANCGALTALLGRGDTVFEDRLNHASLLDGGLFSGARFTRFGHNDVADLERRMQGIEGEKLVVVDGVFSMDGDSAPLADLATVCREQSAWMMVDDAHGIGVLGEGGAGSVAAAGLSADDVPVLMATLGKALGCAGAFVAGDADLIDFLVQEARQYIYTTALPPAVAAAALASVRLLGEESWRREHLRALIARFRAGAGQLGLPLMDSASAIQPLLVGEAADALRLSESLRERGLLIGAIRPPTVPRGTSRLRITLSAAHSEQQVDRLLDALSETGVAVP